MALRSNFEPLDSREWEAILIQAGIQPQSAQVFANAFEANKFSRDTLSMLDRDMLRELGVNVLGEALAIIKLGSTTPVTNAPCSTVRQQASSVPSAKPPKLSLDMTQQQFRKFRIDWDIFVQLTNLDMSKHNITMYNCADEGVQKYIINTIPSFFGETSEKLFDLLELIIP